MADDTALLANFVGPGSRIRVVKSTDEQDLLQQFARLAQLNMRFRQILVVGHSNGSGLQLTSDRSVSWTAMARWVAPFRPKHLAFMACQASLPIPVISLFNEIPTLTDVYGSPFVARKNQLQLIKVLMSYLLKVRAPKSDWIVLGQIANLASTGGMITRWRRRDFMVATANRGQDGLDAVAMIGTRVASALTELMSGRRA